MAIRQLLSYVVTKRISEQDVTEAIEEYEVFKSAVNKKVKTSVPGLLLEIIKGGFDYTVYVTLNGNPIAAFTFSDYNIAGHMAFQPHAFVSKEYRGKGLAKMVYSWFLDAGNTLVTDEHTRMAKSLWDTLSLKYQEAWYTWGQNKLDSQRRRESTHRLLIGKRR